MVVAIPITLVHIARGRGKTADECPAALAINGSLKPAFHCLTGRTETIFFRGNEIVGKTTTPASLAEFLIKADTKEKLKPITFKMDIPNEIVR